MPPSPWAAAAVPPPPPPREITLPPAPRPDLHDPAARGRVERTLAAVSGVVLVRLVPGFERPVDELHAIVDLTITPRQAVRDLQTVLMARFDTATDHRVFSVVQLAQGTVATGPRLAIDHVAITHASGEVRAEVAIRDQGGLREGRASGPTSPHGRVRTVAEAALAAADASLEELSPTLFGAELATSCGHRVATCVIELGTGRARHAVVGSALVRDAEEDAVARSVLDALNRALSETP